VIALHSGGKFARLHYCASRGLFRLSLFRNQSRYVACNQSTTRRFNIKMTENALSTDRGEGPLASYFASFNTPVFQLGGLRANMYLAEDRILCFELVAASKMKSIDSDPQSMSMHPHTVIDPSTFVLLRHALLCSRPHSRR